MGIAIFTMMKKLPFLPIRMILSVAVLAGLSCSCGNPAKNTQVRQRDSAQSAILSARDTVAAPEFPALPINYDQTTVLKNVYVIDREGAVLRQGADQKAPALGRYPYGTKLDVIGEEGDWIAVMDRIQRSQKEADGQTVEVTRWEKVYVAKAKLGTQDKIKLSPKDLNLILLQKVGDKENYYEKGQPLDKYLHLELIDEQTFLAAKRTAQDEMLKDTLSYKKTGMTLDLPLKNGRRLTFTDHDIDNEHHARYDYMGHYDFLNAYAVSGSYWESGDVRLFDRNDGHLIVECGDYPHFSTDKKYLMTLHADPYETTGDLQLFHVKQGKIAPMLFFSFKCWMPAGEEDLTFWGRDGHIYAAVNHIDAYWTEKGFLSDRYQFLRIKVLEP